MGNLIDNAAKNTVGGSITINSELFGSKVCVSIKDTGFGIPDKYATWLNEDDPAAEPQHGQSQGASSGMGLLIVKEIVSMMGAQIHAQRTVDGTIITVLLESEE
nr:ATP-binding protein [Dyadobacter sp. SG02]